MNKHDEFEVDPFAPGRIKDARPVGVLDIGSNSVRLVVYERHARALTPLYNQKSASGLGRGVAETGRLSTQSSNNALRAIRRFALVTRLMGVEQVHILATSAVRESSNGEEFSRQVTELMGAPVRVLSGAEEAHFAAMGIVAGMPDFSGIMGDLGGGSLEFSSVESGEDFEGQTFALGAIRLQDESGNSPLKAAAITRARLKDSKLLKSSKGRTFCAIGGTWRALAKLYQHRRKHPLHMVQGYKVKASSLLRMCNMIVAQAENSGDYPGAETVSSSRRDLVPYGAAALAEVIRRGAFGSVVFSALGVREGYLFDLLPSAERASDPLLHACAEMSVLRARSPEHGDDLVEFTNQFMAATQTYESKQSVRLRKAVCALSDIGWRGHPDYRGEQSVDLVAFGAMVGVDHPGRAFLAQALSVRYMGLKHKGTSTGLLKLAGIEATQRARLLGALLRVAYPMSGGMAGILAQISFEPLSDDGQLVLKLPIELAFLEGKRLRHRLAQLANIAGLDGARVSIV